jgi:hypothetical protein
VGANCLNISQRMDTYLSSSMDKKLRPAIPFNATLNLVERDLAPLSLIGKAFLATLLNKENIVSTIFFLLSFTWFYDLIFTVQPLLILSAVGVVLSSKMNLLPVVLQKRCTFLNFTFHLSF